jgi:glycosyltransferase involved in cell wall biosynthesis
MSNGTGGHLHSLNHISKEIGRNHEIKIITIGCGFSAILNSNPYFLAHFPFNGLNFLSMYRFFKTVTGKFNPDIYHFFDYHAYDVLRFFLNSHRHRIVLTKCGGPNTTWPYVNNLILFHRENLNWYKSISKFNDSQITLIPNRIQKIHFDPTFQPVVKDNRYFTFVRICRIGPVYKTSIINTIRFIEHLLHDGFVVKLFIIGTIEDQVMFQDIKDSTSQDNSFIEFITKNEITKEASRMLYLADATIGTGRAFMEASSLGIPVLTLNSQDIFPILVDSSNFDALFQTNFSDRNRLPGFNREENLGKIKKMITDNEYYAELSTFSNEFFKKHFDVAQVQETYSNLYKTAKLGPNKYLGDARLIFSSIKSYFKSHKMLSKNKKDLMVYCLFLFTIIFI